MIFYRDGVSEGEFAHVARSEIPMIKSQCGPVIAHGHRSPVVIGAFRNMGWTNERIQPKLLFIVVGKRYADIPTELDPG